MRVIYVKNNVAVICLYINVIIDIRYSTFTYQQIIPDWKNPASTNCTIVGLFKGQVLKLNSLNLMSAYLYLFSGHAGSSLILYGKELSGLLGRRCELVSGDSLFSVSVIEKPVLWNGKVETPICFTSTILLLASREIEGSILSAVTKGISFY